MKPYIQQTLTEYLDELSSDKPIPGGGSVSAYVASLAMGLTQMVGRISLKRKKKEGLSAEEEKKGDGRLSRRKNDAVYRRWLLRQ